MEKESRRLSINWRVFTKTDIRRLAKILETEFQLAKKRKHYPSLSFQLYCEGGISYESDSISILEDGGPLDIKRILAIQMTFYEMERHIDISLREGNHGNELYVRGDEKNWVQGTFTTLQEIIDSIKPQDNLILKNRKLAPHIIAIGTGSFFYLVTNFLFSHILIEPIQINVHVGIFYPIAVFLTNRWVLILLLIICLWLEGLLFAVPIFNWLVKLWPDIEFDFGPEHLNQNKIRRQRIWIVISLVVIPTLINIITNIR